MADFELDQESVSRATALSSRLLEDLRTLSHERPRVELRREIFSQQRYADQAEGVPISDVLDNVAQMAREFAIMRRWDSEVLCLKLDDGQVVPISISESFGGPLGPYGSENWFEVWEREFPSPFPRRFWRDIRQQSWQQEEGASIAGVGEVEEVAERNLASFLSYRFAGMRSWTEWIGGIRDSLFGGTGRSTGPPPPAVGPGGGLQVQVSCLTPGLRIHVAPVYFISWVFFGSPTTPVSSYVLPGRYTFAGDGPMLPRLTRDRGVFSIPPSYHPALTRF